MSVFRKFAGRVSPSASSDTPTPPLGSREPVGESNPTAPEGSSPTIFDWADHRQARHLVAVPTDSAKADDQDLRDLIEQATARTVSHPARQWAWAPERPLPTSDGAA